MRPTVVFGSVAGETAKAVKIAALRIEDNPIPHPAPGFEVAAEEFVPRSAIVTTMEIDAGGHPVTLFVLADWFQEDAVEKFGGPAGAIAFSSQFGR